MVSPVTFDWGFKSGGRILAECLIRGIPIMHPIIEGRSRLLSDIEDHRIECSNRFTDGVSFCDREIGMTVLEF